MTKRVAQCADHDKLRRRAARRKFWRDENGNDPVARYLGDGGYAAFIFFGCVIGLCLTGIGLLMLVARYPEAVVVGFVGLLVFWSLYSFYQVLRKK